MTTDKSSVSFFYIHVGGHNSREARPKLENHILGLLQSVLAIRPSLIIMNVSVDNVR